MSVFPSRFIAPLLSVVGALAVTGLLLAALGANPAVAYGRMVVGALGTTRAISDTVARAEPICLIALGVALTFRGGLWNVGGEGQFYAGAIGAALTGILVPAPAWILVPLELLGGMAAGAVTAFVPAVLKACFNINEILVTLMLNFVPVLLVSYLVAGPFAQGMSETTVDILPEGDLPWLVAGNLRLHAGLPLLIGAVAILAFLVARTGYGYRLRATGSNPLAARAAGMNVTRTQFAAFLIAGALSGMAGMVQVTAIHHNLLAGMSVGYGFTAVVAALLGRLNPWGILLASFGFAALQVGGDSMQRTTGIESSTVFVIEGLILLFLLGGRLIGRERLQIA
jgi:general nucleoside transport system permease protein